MIMATRRMKTRLQERKKDLLLARKECGGSGSSPSSTNTNTTNTSTTATTTTHHQRKVSLVDMEGVVDDENSLAVVEVYTGTSLCKSFPLDSHRDGFSGKVERRKPFKSDHAGKRRQTLSERGVNSMRTVSGGPRQDEKRADDDVIRRRQQQQQESPPAVFARTKHSPPSETEDGIPEEITTELDEQTSLDEMTCDDSLTAALLPLVQGSFRDACCPPFYNAHFPVDSCMYTDPWRERSERRKLPRGVVDIDQDADTLNTCEYSQDIMEYLKHKEVQSPLSPYFLDTSPEVTARMRGVLMDWVIQVQAHEDLGEETLHLCVALIDRYLAAVKTRMPRLQLVGITCLLIATKFLERFAPEISTLCYLTAHSFRPSQVIRYEVMVLLALDFDLTIAVSTTFLRRYLQIHQDTQPQEVPSLASYLLDLSITSVKMASVLPSLLSGSAIYLARRMVLGTTQAWTPSLAHYTTYTPHDLSDTVNELANLLFKAPSSKFQGARTKYNVEQHCYISFSPMASAEAVESHFAAEGHVCPLADPSNL